MSEDTTVEHNARNEKIKLHERAGLTSLDTQSGELSGTTNTVQMVYVLYHRLVGLSEPRTAMRCPVIAR